MRSAQSADRRLVVAGFRPLEAVLPRLVVLAAATARRRRRLACGDGDQLHAARWLWFTAGNLLVGLTYGAHRRARRRVLGQLGATYLVLFSRCSASGSCRTRCSATAPPAASPAFPDYGAGRVIIDGAFSRGFHAWGALMLALSWLAGPGSRHRVGAAPTPAQRRLTPHAAEPEVLRLDRGSRAQAATGSSSPASALSSAAAGSGRGAARRRAAPATAMPAAPRKAAE